mmetsp:Transcript_67711/g.180273  ORF Transcript_67711/g.180273 Transcript_67711/m.180273 type:complete len:218 (+) Transcript_67711:702-1355(+)
MVIWVLSARIPNTTTSSPPMATGRTRSTARFPGIKDALPVSRGGVAAMRPVRILAWEISAATTTSCCCTDPPWGNGNWGRAITFLYAFSIFSRVIPEASRLAMADTDQTESKDEKNDSSGVVKSSVGTGTTGTSWKTAVEISPAHHIRRNVCCVSNTTTERVSCLTMSKIFSRSSRKSESRNTRSGTLRWINISIHRARAPPPPLWWHKNIKKRFPL